TSYGQTTGLMAVEGGTGVVRVSAGLSNLLGGQVYHARLAVRTAAGTVLGPDQRFISFPGERVIAWGANESSQTNVPGGLSNVVAVAGGAARSLALRNDGTVVAWGSYTNGGRPVRMTVPGGLGSNVVGIASGDA